MHTARPGGRELSSLYLSEREDGAPVLGCFGRLSWVSCLRGSHGRPVRAGALGRDRPTGALKKSAGLRRRWTEHHKGREHEGPGLFEPAARVAVYSPFCA